ncbi:uncharacterized protein LOC129599731 [Paramacrobiotus metropolitanus]|uniref:uncharacterized protein LOC129599731 n=1 Tax=Paramacrobiotus metropolitanus TaxID=2943436 RepID=UPI0024459129|nr:uncharacterized protein LOC129599731 [Paramacrobiotus metropolitanus]
MDFIRKMFVLCLIVNYSRVASAGREPIRCQTVIIGTGIAGAYAAYKLAPTLKSDLCVIERHAYDGGRIIDVSEAPGGPRWGIGAIRVMAEHVNMRYLAGLFNITLQPGMGTEYVHTAGRDYFRSVDGSTRGRAAGCMTTRLSNACWTDAQIVQAIVRHTRAHPEEVDRFPDFRDLVRALVGTEGLAFLQGFTRFNTFFAQSHSPASMLDFLEWEYGWKDQRIFYTVGGMATFVQRLMDAVRSTSARVFHNQTIVQMDADVSFTLRSPTHTFLADEVIASIDPFNLKQVRGNVAAALVRSREFQSLLPHVVSTVTAWWPARWWERVPINGTAGRLTRYINHELCLNSMDIPVFPYGIAQNVSRVVYDDGQCLPLWRKLITNRTTPDAQDIHLHETRNMSDPLVTAVMKYLRAAFPGVKIPLPRKMLGMLRENAWHYQRAGSPFNDLDIRRWSRAPLPGRKLALVGEAYNSRHAMWSEGALKTVMAVLAFQYGMSYPCVDAAGQPEYKTDFAKCTPATARNRT